MTLTLVFAIGLVAGFLLAMVVFPESVRIVITPHATSQLCKPFGLPCQPVERKPWTVL